MAGEAVKPPVVAMRSDFSPSTRIKFCESKELKLKVNELGQRLYEDYAQEILRWHFSPMFQSLDKIPAEYRPYICSAFYNAMHGGKCVESAGEH